MEADTKNYLEVNLNNTDVPQDSTNIISNPWTYSDLDEFLYYCCPQCDEKYKTKSLFVDHALISHPESESKMKTELRTLEQSDSTKNSENHMKFSIKAEDLNRNVELENEENILEDILDDEEYFDEWNYETELLEDQVLKSAKKVGKKAKTVKKVVKKEEIFEEDEQEYQCYR